jgi:hypothetical protein
MSFFDEVEREARRDYYDDPPEDDRPTAAELGDDFEVSFVVDHSVPIDADDILLPEGDHGKDVPF